jgi:hypothetical protein
MSYGDFMNHGPDQVSFTQPRLLEHSFPPPNISPSLSAVPVALPPSEPLDPPLDPGPTIRPPVVLLVGVPSPVVTIMGPPAFSAAAVCALSVDPPSSPQFVLANFAFLSLDFSPVP